MWQLAAESVESSSGDAERALSRTAGRPRTCHLGDLDIVGSPRLPTCDRTRRAALMTDLLLAQQMV